MLTRMIKCGIIVAVLATLGGCAGEQEPSLSAFYYPAPWDTVGAAKIPPTPSRSGTASDSDQPAPAQLQKQNAVESGAMVAPASPAVKCLSALPESCRAYLGYSYYWGYPYYGPYYNPHYGYCGSYGSPFHCSIGAYLHHGHHDFGHHWGGHGIHGWGRHDGGDHHGGHH